jgi:hypothetical protein
MLGKSQRGEGRLGSIISLLVLLAVVYAAWNVAPAYIANYGLKDKMNEIARSPRGTTKDDKILDMLDQYVREERLDSYVQRSMFQVSTLDTSRRIFVVYERPVKILPGFEKVLTFENDVSQPLVF